MKVFYSAASADKFCRKGSAITMGNYDGLHVGHRYILDLLKKEARRRKLTAILYTFEPHPVKLLSPENAPPLINTLKQKIELLEKTGIDAVVIEKFNYPFSHLNPADFFQKYVVGRLNAKFIAVGYDFTFGAKRHGNRETLEALCPQAGIGHEIMEPYFRGETLVSSSLIRKRILEGKVAEVIPLLARPFFLDGKIVRGDERGKKLGIPTANMKPENELIPKSGVYATQSIINKKKYGSVTNIGFRPTFGKGQRTIETHIFGLKQSVYGKKMRLIFLKRIRDERRFESRQALVLQIRKDMTNAKRVLKNA